MLVTGAARGLGHSIASAFKKHGAIVWSADVSDPLLPIEGVRYEKIDLEDTK